MKTAVITTGGLGTRLLTCTKGNPKTMLPVYAKTDDTFNEPILKPLIEYIFDNLYESGFRRFCFIVGAQTKSSILNHMLPDSDYLQLLEKRNVPEDKRFVNVLKKLYTKIINCDIKWISQPTPMGFGDALLKAKRFVGNDTFLLHAGDAYFPDYAFLSAFIENYEKTENASSSLLLKHVKNMKGFGIAEVIKKKGISIILKVEEKPKKPRSNLAILPVYIFRPNIFDALRITSKGYNHELQVTDGISTLLSMNEKVLGFNYGKNPWYDIGTPARYLQTIQFSYKKSTQ